MVGKATGVADYDERDLDEIVIVPLKSIKQMENEKTIRSCRNWLNKQKNMNRIDRSSYEERMMAA